MVFNGVTDTMAYAKILENQGLNHRRRSLDSLEFARHIVDVLDEHKAENIVLLDLRPDTVIADFFILCTGTSDRQLKALVDHIKVGVKEAFERRPFSEEGTADSGWMLMDYGDVVVHMFLEDVRSYYDLEGLWNEANVLVSIQ
ncbi:MAG: ribosome silencing factor [Anaerolineaceae bacterium]|nr:ribosome silencing factor [Anaerolineaceae bacterium]